MLRLLGKRSVFSKCRMPKRLHVALNAQDEMNFLDAHAFVYEYVGIFARGDGNVFGFPASDLSFYGANWKDILFDAAKIWGAHVIFYDNSPDDLVDNMCKLLFSHNLGVDRKEYERMKQEADLWLSSCGRKGAFSLRSDELDLRKSILITQIFWILCKRASMKWSLMELMQMIFRTKLFENCALMFTKRPALFSDANIFPFIFRFTI